MGKFPATDYYINQAFSVYLAGTGPASEVLNNNSPDQLEGYKNRQ
jgi:hypothetical protein